MHYNSNLNPEQLTKASSFSNRDVCLRQNGFTLIELMVVVAIMGILASIAYPSYTNYVKQGKATEAPANLAVLKNRMEQYYQDNKTYEDTGGLTAPCSPSAGDAKLFTYSCTDQTPTTFTITADAISGNGIDNFQYTIDQSNNKTSTYDGGSTVNCWVTTKSGSGSGTC